ncbi:MAG: DUF11 domain-containing protein [Chloroflexi bacterium]|nr:DUF11 domain-containing protein [Chloroflexota bacterium]
MKIKHVLVTFILGIGLALVLLWAIEGSSTLAMAAPDTKFKLGTVKGPVEIPSTPNAELRVCPSGCDYSSVQDAVDAASEGDMIKVAAGDYTGVNNYGRLAQVVYISKTVTIRGGYTMAFIDPPNPDTNLTTLDAQEQGRVLYVTGDISATVEGLRIIGGDATGLGGDWDGDAGGGVYVSGDYAAHCSAMFDNNHIYSNTAEYGGGLYLSYSDATLSGNTVTSNTASESGGGLYLDYSDATLTSNAVTNNTASGTVWGKGGGGLYLYYSDATLTGNNVLSNTAEYGGGLYVSSGDASLTGNAIVSNTAYSSGGGIYVRGDANLTGNTVVSNTAHDNGGGIYVSGGAMLTDNIVSGNTAGTYGYGGGLYVNGKVMLVNNTVSGNAAYAAGGVSVSGGAIVISNTVSGNTARDYSGGGMRVSGEATLIGNVVTLNTANTGGGLALDYSNATLRGNIVTTNTASNNGGGVWIANSTSTLDNTIVTDNAVIWFEGSGLYISDDASPILRHTTIAHNHGGNGQGIYVDDSNATLINTILVSHTVGIYVGSGAQATLTGTLWGSEAWGNEADTGGAGTVVSNTNVTGNPAFVDHDGGDYHIGATSAAIDQGVDTDVPLDMDGEYRPPSAPPDMGADERIVAPTCHVRLNGGGTVYDAIQTALVASTSPSDLVEVSGVCEDVVDWQGMMRVAVLTRTLTLRGGYSLDFATWDPETYPTVLNGHLQGGVLAIGTGISPTVEYLTLLGGVTVEGGGVWSWEAEPVLRYLRVAHNVASQGGGIYLEGGIGKVVSNTVETNRAGNGGGLYLEDNDATVSGNTVSGNAAGSGGGLYLGSWDTNAVLNDNTVSDNTADYGGGVYLGNANATLSNNAVSDNTAQRSGGGLYVYGESPTLDGNTINGNSVTGANSWDGGGGLDVRYGYATVRGNVIINNVAQNNGGGLRLDDQSNATLINNVVADNLAQGNGSGIYADNNASPRLLYTTLARNSGGDGSGIHVTGSSNVELSNTILVSHTVGVTATAGSVINLEGTLWGSGVWTNGSNVGGAGTVVSSTNVTGNPAFVDHDNGNYHIGSTSAAIDQGDDVGVYDDIDGTPRPAAWGYDLGADERPGPVLYVSKSTPQMYFNPGEIVTYTLLVTATGVGASTSVVATDTLPAQQQPLAAVASQGSCTVLAGWGSHAVCTLGDVSEGHTARITLTAQVTTSVLASLPYPMRNTVQAVGTNAAADQVTLDTWIHDCHVRLNDNSTDYATVQAAVDASAQLDDVVKVSGYCAGVNDYGDLRQAVYLSKTLTIRGGYTSTFTGIPDPQLNPTTLDAHGQGRVMLITGTIAPTVEGLRIVGGDSTGLAIESPWYDRGGGVYVHTATVAIRDCAILSNTATASGGGVYLYHSDGVLEDNRVSGNETANFGGKDYSVCGGLDLTDSPATLRRNTIYENRTDGRGGGICLTRSDAILDNNVIVDNALTLSYSWVNGSGMYVYNSSPTLRHNTIARNHGGNGQGIYATYNSHVVLTNTILVSHTVGLYVEGGSQATLEATLWGSGAWANSTNTDGAGAIVTGTHNYSGDPAFVTPGAEDYHITSASVAIDKGVDAGVTTDIDGQPRPYGSAPDLGADEWGESLPTVTISSTTGGALVYTDTQGSPTTVEFPAGAVTDATTIAYTPLGAATPPSGFSFAGHAFDLSAYRNGTPLSGLVFSAPVTVTIHYTEADVAGMNENTLDLRYWNGSAWATDGITLTERNTAQNYIVFEITHLSRFALFGETDVRTISVEKSVTPESQVNYGDELTYTLVISAVKGTQVALYDQLEGTSWVRFVGQEPTGVAHANGTITGTLTVTPTNQITVSFVTKVGIPGTVGWTVSVANRACIYPVGGTIADDCTWSNTVTNDAFHPYNIYLPLVIRNS